MLFTNRLAGMVLASASLLAILTALFVQYGLGWRPCELCLLQRVPIVLAGLVGLASLVPDHVLFIRQGMLRLAVLLFWFTAVLAAYHYGVEQHWWIYEGSCAADRTAVLSHADFALALSQPVVVRCDEPPWIWHGITLAGLNVLYSAGVGVLALVLMRKEDDKNGR